MYGKSWPRGHFWKLIRVLRKSVREKRTTYSTEEPQRFTVSILSSIWSFPFSAPHLQIAVSRKNELATWPLGPMLCSFTTRPYFIRTREINKLRIIMTWAACEFSQIFLSGIFRWNIVASPLSRIILPYRQGRLYLYFHLDSYSSLSVISYNTSITNVYMYLTMYE